jgi:3-oxoacyl-[acyl-carrier protein] reductase
MTMAKSIASEFAAVGITSNAIAPAQIATDMMKDLPDLSSRIPVGRYGTPEEVAALVGFLASSEAGYITGEVIDINGGFLID